VPRCCAPRAAHARPELLRVLEQLPELEVTELAQLWMVLDASNRANPAV
jgi:hypothetical protein